MARPKPSTHPTTTSPPQPRRESAGGPRRLEWAVRWKRPGGRVQRRIFQTKAAATDLYTFIRDCESSDCGWGVVGVPPETTHDTENCLSCNPPKPAEWAELLSRPVGPWEMQEREEDCQP